MDRWFGLAVSILLAADPPGLSPKLTEDLAEIRAKIERLEKDGAKLDPRELKLGLAEAGEWIDEFVAEAKLSEETPMVHGLRERLVAIEKKSTSARAKMKEAMTPTKSAVDANREKLESLLKIEVDLKKVSFQRDVAPIIADRCLGCHNANRKQGEFDGSTYELFVEQITPGKPEDSHLLNLVTGKEQPRMPRGNAGFDPESVAIWTAWIEQGAKFDGPSPNAPITEYLVNADMKRRERISKLSADEVAQLHQVAAERHLDIVKPKRPISTYQTPNFSVRTTFWRRLVPSMEHRRTFGRAGWG